MIKAMYKTLYNLMSLPTIHRYVVRGHYKLFVPNYGEDFDDFDSI